MDDKVQQLKTAESLMEHVEELHKKKEVLQQLQTQQQIAFEKFRVAFVEDERLSKVPVLIQILEETEKTSSVCKHYWTYKRYESLSTAKKTLTETLKQFDGLVEVSNLLRGSTKSEEIYSLLSILSQNYKKYSQVLQAQLQVERLTVIANINVAVIEEEVKKTDELKKLYVQHSVVKQRYEKQVRM